MFAAKLRESKARRSPTPESDGNCGRPGHPVHLNIPVQMATLRQVSTGRTRLLEPQHIVGRAPTCSLQIGERYVSAQHALLRWNGHGWELRDLNSRNGTFLDGERLKKAEEVAIGVGARIAFGKAEQVWELVDDRAPCVMVVPTDGGEPVVFEDDLLALPSADDPQVTIYRSEGAWLLERADESTTPVTDLETFEVDGRRWRFRCVEGTAKTTLADVIPIGLEVEFLQLTFSVSANEEHVHLQMSCAGQNVDMGSRSRNYLLLTLARRRLEDVTAGLPETACGWVNQDDYPNDPMMAPAQVNLDVFRIRKQFQKVGVTDAARIIERRPRTRQLRIGTGHLAVVRL
jgi:hypothetical protein